MHCTHTIHTPWACVSPWVVGRCVLLLPTWLAWVTWLPEICNGFLLCCYQTFAFRPLYGSECPTLLGPKGLHIRRFCLGFCAASPGCFNGRQQGASVRVLSALFSLTLPSCLFDGFKLPGDKKGRMRWRSCKLTESRQLAGRDFPGVVIRFSREEVLGNDMIAKWHFLCGEYSSEKGYKKHLRIKFD